MAGTTLPKLNPVDGVDDTAGPVDGFVLFPVVEFEVFSGEREIKGIGGKLQAFACCRNPIKTIAVGMRMLWDLLLHDRQALVDLSDIEVLKISFILVNHNISAYDNSST